jgi:hypothetical protein
MDVLRPQPGTPPRPHAPSADRNPSWQQSVEQKHIVPDLTVRDVGLSVFGETRSLHNRTGSNESIDTARQKIAHAMINDAELAHQTGRPRQIVHPPIEPSDKVKREEQTAYESSLRAAREAYLNAHDPTNGATHFNMRPRPDRSNWKFVNGTPEGLTVSTLSGPYDNSFPNKNAPAHTTWLNTYQPGENEKRSHKK